MTFIKFALSEDSFIEPTAAILEDDEINSHFRKVIADLREEQKKQAGTQLIPVRPEEFMYGQAIMMHAAEASLLDHDSGEFLKNAKGEPVRGWFEEVEDTAGKKSAKWVSPDGIKPYKNQNGDIFPEEDLIKAHKEWVGKPLCRDHVSSTVDGVRGIIVDTFYDPQYKRVHALFALDRKNYADLARKIEAGYATNVSMGTAVGRSICTECANVATVESEYCHHIRSKANYGEINKDLSPIELSIVVTGADPRAKVRTVLAHLKNYHKSKQAQGQATVRDFLINATVEELSSVDADVLMRQAGTLKDHNKEVYSKVMEALINKYESEGVDLATHGKLASLVDETDTTLRDRIDNMPIKMDLGEGTKAPAPSADWASTQGVGNTPPPQIDEIGQSGLEVAQEARNSEGFTPSGGPVMNFSFVDRKNVIKESNLTSQNGLDDKEMQMPMNFEDLKKRAERRLQAYHLGTEDPKVTPYPLMGKTHDEMRSQDRHMDTSNELDIKPDGLPADDVKTKELMQRASREERRQLRASYLAQIKEAAQAEVLTDKANQPAAVKTPDGAIHTLKAKDAAAKEEDDKKNKKDDDKKSDKKDDKKNFADKMKALREKKQEKKAYHQGTEDPGKAPYPLMGDQDGLRNNEDKQMKQTGDLGGPSGMVPGDEQLKGGLQRMASMKGRLMKGASPAENTWHFVNKDSGETLLTVNASAAYEDELDQVVEGTAQFNEGGESDLTGAEFFSTAAYAREVMKRIRAAGLEATAQELGGELPAAPEAPAAEGDSMQSKVAEALSKIEAAVEELRSTVGAEELKEVELPESSAEGSMPAAEAAKKQLIEVYAHMNGLAEELNFLGESLDSDTALVSEASAAVKDAESLVEHYNSVLADFANTEKPAPTKQASELLSELLKVRAERRKQLVAEAMGGAYYMADTEEEEMDDEDEDVEADIDAALERLSKEEEGMDAHYAEDEMLAVDEFAAKDGEDEDDDEDDKDEDKKDDDKDEQDNLDGELLAKDDKSEDKVSKEEKKEMKETAEDVVEDHEDDMHALDSVASRRAWRESLLEKIAAAGTDDMQGMPLNEEYSKTRSDAGTKTHLDTGVADNNDMVENLHEQHRHHLDVARSEPRNVRMAAEALNGAIKAGVIKSADLNSLVAEGKVESEVASYWKSFYGQVDGGSEFASGLVAEFDKGKKAEASVNASEEQEARLKRAYALALDAQERDLIPRGRASLHGYVDNLIKLPDDAFESMKNIVAQTQASGQKVATAAPRPGMTYDDMDRVAVQPGYELLGSGPRTSGTPSFQDLASLFG